MNLLFPLPRGAVLLLSSLGSSFPVVGLCQLSSGHNTGIVIDDLTVNVDARWKASFDGSMNITVFTMAHPATVAPLRISAPLSWHCGHPSSWCLLLFFALKHRLWLARKTHHCLAPQALLSFKHRAPPIWLPPTFG